MRRLLFAALFVSFVGIQYLSADETAVLRPSQRRVAIEKILDSPLNWQPVDGKDVTLAELIEYVREEHHLQIRWDSGSLGMVFGDQAPFGELAALSLDRQAYCPAPYPSQGAATFLGTSQPNVNPGQTQPQPLLPYAASSKPAAAELPSVPSHGYAAPYPAQASSTPVVNQPVAVSVPDMPRKNQPVPGSLATQQAATLPANQPVAVSVPDVPSMDQPVPSEPAVSGPEAMIAEYLASPISLSTVSLKGATVREGLQQLLDSVSVQTTAIPLQVGLPFTTRALALDLLVDENSVLITTQLRANAKKETRIYRLGSLSELPPESLERVITHSVRPWSWRNQANEIAEELASRWPTTSIPIPIELDAFEGIKLKSAEEGSGSALSANAMPKVSEDAVAATGQLVAGGAVAAAHSIVAALEIVHYGDPPTGVIESLPGMLIITQSQAAHREIKELLYELGRQDDH